MSSPFQKSFSAKSPLAKHDPKALKALEARLAKVKKGEEGAEGQGGVDYELQAKIEGQIKEAKGDHGAKKTGVTNDSTPLQAGGYTGGGIGKRASTAHHYQNLFNKIEAGTKEHLANDKAKKKKAAKAAATKTATDKTQQTADATQKDITATLNMTPAERMAKLNKQYGA